MKKNPFYAGHSDWSESLCTGNRDPHTVISYRYLREELGICQQHGVLSLEYLKQRESIDENTLYETVNWIFSNAVGKGTVLSVVSTNKNECDGDKGVREAFSLSSFNVGDRYWKKKSTKKLISFIQWDN